MKASSGNQNSNTQVICPLTDKQITAITIIFILMDSDSSPDLPHFLTLSTLAD